MPAATSRTPAQGAAKPAPAPQVPAEDRLAPYKQIALFVALFQAVQIALLWNNPTVTGPVIDSSEFHDEAVRLSHGWPAPHFPYAQSPLFPWVLSLVYRVMGPQPVHGLFLQALLTIVIACEVLFLARRLMPPRAALVAAGIASTLGPLLFFDGQIISAPLDAAAALGALVAAVIIGDRAGLRQQLLLGCLGGVAIAARGTIAPFVLVLAARPLVAWRAERRRALRRSGAIVAGIFLGLMPVGLANWSRSGHFLMSTVNDGLNLWLGNNPDIRATTALRPGHSWDYLRAEPAREGAIDPISANAYFRHKALAWIAAHPGDFARDFLKKLGDTLNGLEVPRNLDPYGEFSRSDITDALLWKIDGFRFPMGLVFPLGLLGLAWRWRDVDRRKAEQTWLTAALVLGNAVGIAFFFPSGRYRLAIDLALVAPAVDAVVLLWHSLKYQALEELRRPGILGLGLAVASALWANLGSAQTGPDMSRQVLAIGVTSDLSANRLQDATTKIQALLDLNPGDADAWRALGLVQDRLGRSDMAIASLKEAVDAAPDYAHAWQHLGALYLEKKSVQPAIEALQSAVENNPAHPLAWAQLAEVYYDAQQIPDAVRAGQQAVRVNPDNATGWRFLGAALLASGDPKDAVPALQKAAEMAPGGTAPRYQLARAYRDLGRKDDAIREAYEILRIAPTHHGALELLHSLGVGPAPSGAAGDEEQR